MVDFPYNIGVHVVKDSDTDFKLLNSALVHYSVNWGVLERPVVCEGCNREFSYVPFRLIFNGHFVFPICAHHYCYDFNHVLDVVWLCVGCHSRVHRWLFREIIEPVRDLLESEGYNLNRLGFIHKLFGFSAWNIEVELNVEYVMK